MQSYLSQLLNLFKAFLDKITQAYQQAPDVITRVTKYLCRACSRQHHNKDVFNLNMNVLKIIFDKCQRRTGKYMIIDVPEALPLLIGMNRMKDFCTEQEADSMNAIAIMLPQTQLNVFSAEQQIPFIKSALSRHHMPLEFSSVSCAAINLVSSYCETYWEGIIEPHLEEIISCLKGMIKKQSKIMISVAHILGKLGGRCRSFQKGAVTYTPAQFKEVSSSADPKGACSVEVSFLGEDATAETINFDLQFGEYVSRARRLATERDFAKLSARFPMRSYYTICCGTILLFIDKDMPEISVEGLRDQEGPQFGAASEASLERIEPNKKAYEDALTGFFGFAAQKEFREESKTLIDGIISYFAILFAQNKYEGGGGNSEREIRYIGAEAIVKAIVNLHCSSNKQVSKYSDTVCLLLIATINTITGEPSSNGINGFWKHYIKHTKRLCVIPKYTTKRAGWKSLKFMLLNAPRDWLFENIEDVLFTLYLLADVKKKKNTQNLKYSYCLY